MEKILFDESYFTALIADLKKATLRVDVETYIFSNDEFGLEIATLLAEVAAKGVKVRLLLDGIGSRSLSQPITNLFKRAGVIYRVYHPIPWVLWHWQHVFSLAKWASKTFYLFSKINRRNHRKVFIIDKRIVYIGSANVSSCHVARENKEKTWRDTGVRMENVNITNLEKAFNRAWKYAVKRLHFPEKKRYQHDQIFRLNDTWRQRRKNYIDLLFHLRHCKKRIWITNAYFVPNMFILRRLSHAAKKGVKVKILLPHKSDILISSLVARTFYLKLLKSGVRIYEYMPSMLHAKTLILDEWFCIGSSNFNSRSFRHDLEVDVVIQDSISKQILEKQFFEDLSHSKQIFVSDIVRQSIFKTLLGRFLLFFKRWF